MITRVSQTLKCDGCGEILLPNTPKEDEAAHQEMIDTFGHDSNDFAVFCDDCYEGAREFALQCQKQFGNEV